MNNYYTKPYFLQEGEFYYAKSKDREWLGIKDKIGNQVALELNKESTDFLIWASLYSTSDFIHPIKDLIELRPATGFEIKIMKAAVKRLYDKEWNENQWINIPESDKEWFNKWKMQIVLIFRE